MQVDMRALACVGILDSKEHFLSGLPSLTTHTKLIVIGSDIATRQFACLLDDSIDRGRYYEYRYLDPFFFIPSRRCYYLVYCCRLIT